LQAGQVLQSGPVNRVFARPANATVARILGAETIAAGVAVGENLIEIPGGTRIMVAGPPLAPGARVGWSIKPERLRLAEAGGYPGVILEVHAAIAGRQALRFRLGETVLRVTAEEAAAPKPGPAQLVIPSSAVQVWPIA